MTQKEFFESIMYGDVITEEMKTHAANEFEKIAVRAEKRKNYRTPAQKENDDIKEKILECFVDCPEMTKHSSIFSLISSFSFCAGVR